MRWMSVFAVVLTALSANAQTPDTDMSVQSLPEDYLAGVPPDSVIQGFLCPMHPHVTAEQPGRRCYLCDMELVDGRIRMPHGSHEPRYGGIFFMSRDNWHHIEGALPQPGLFRFYLYDNYSLPMPVVYASGRLVFQEFIGPDGEILHPPVDTPLVPASDGVSFIVADDRLAPGRDFHVRIRFSSEQPEEDRFDFTFYAHSGPALPEKNLTQDALELPQTPTALLAAIRVRVETVDTLIAQNRLTEIFLPALETKNLALTLLDHGHVVNEEDTHALSVAVKTVVKAAWLLDLYGDYGDKPEAEKACRMLTEATEKIRRLYGASSP
ncbi:MAG: hypothetical protein FJY97_11655 [candidate division Zixibacteria bacterium]|nr:hypothetical protein [candidate division Zixibacteria bacterium]